MNYDAFRTAWYAALVDAGLWSYLMPATETIDLAGMSRTYEAFIHLMPAEEVEPFHASAGLSWTWNALQAARTATTEEDAVAAFIGEESRHMDTELPRLRVDISLNASLTWGSHLPLPAADQWRDWLAEVDVRLEPLLSTEWERWDEQMIIMAYRGEPEATVHPDADGHLRLHAVRLEAWESIDLPRQWDDPHREQEDPTDQLADFVDRIRKALLAWNQTLTHLLPR